MAMAADHIIFTVTNDLNFDQRMQRICRSLSRAGYRVTLAGVGSSQAAPLQQEPYHQHRIRVYARKGKLFYLEYNLKLFLWLMKQQAQLVCAIDLDTLIPVYYASRLKGIKRVYDAHELFCEMKEVVSRPFIHRIWKWVEQTFVPKFPAGYTVNEPIAQIFKQEYAVRYEVIRNVPLLQPADSTAGKEAFLLYQGAVNEGRAFEVLIPAMQWIPYPLHIYGDGNFLEQATALIRKYGLQHKVMLKGKLLPHELRVITSKAILGFTLFENNGLSNYYSLANRFFDYVHAATPQVCVDFPVYRELNKNRPVAVLVDDTDPKALASAVNGLLQDKDLYEELQQNCLFRREEWNWQREQEVLIAFYQKILSAVV